MVNQKNPTTLTIVITIGIIIFLLLLASFNLNIPFTSMIVLFMVFGLGIAAVHFLFTRGGPLEPMKEAMKFYIAWHKDVYKEELNFREFKGYHGDFEDK